MRHAIWIAFVVLLAFLLWQTAAVDPLWPPILSGLLLVIICVVAGLRIGADSAAAYIDDVHRINKTLADQNCELQIANADLLDQLSSEISASAATSSEEVSGPRF